MIAALHGITWCYHNALFHCVLFYSIVFYFILLYCILFNCIVFYWVTWTTEQWESWQSLVLWTPSWMPQRALCLHSNRHLYVCVCVCVCERERERVRGCVCRMGHICAYARVRVYWGVGIYHGWYVMQEWTGGLEGGRTYRGPYCAQWESLRHSPQRCMVRPVHVTVRGVQEVNEWSMRGIWEENKSRVAGV